MQDPDTPPVVEEGEVSVGVVGVRLIVAEPRAATGNSKAEAFTPLPWITATEPP